MCVFDIVDVSKKNKILSGKGFGIIQKIIDENEEVREYIMRLMKIRDDTEDNYMICIEELRNVYKYVFCDDDNRLYEGNMNIPSNVKRECIRICNFI